MNVLDLFSGIGGFSLGLERAGGFRTVAFCEIEPYCRAVLARHWPGVPCHTDVRTLPRIEGVDLICGGVPCQPASVAGSRRGSADERWLWPAFLEVVRAHRPAWVVAENPVGLVSLRPDGLPWVCGSLRDLGYSVWPVVISAYDVGAPHLRKRVWIVAHASSARRWQELRGAHGDEGSDAGRPAADLHEPCGDGAQRHVADAAGLLALAGGEHARTDAARHSGATGHGEARGAGEGAADVSDADRDGRRGIEQERRSHRRDTDAAGDGAEGPAMADANVGGLEVERLAKHLDECGAFRCEPDGRGAWGWGLGEDNVADADGRDRHGRSGDVQVGRSGSTSEAPQECESGGTQWSVEPDVGRVAHGVPARVDRLRALGNALVPQVAEIIGRAIMKASR